MRTVSRTRPDAGTANAVGSHGFVVHEGVRHIAIDVLPREPLTFRAACGQDIIEDEHPSVESRECPSCLRFERTWLRVKATDVI
jgi:hypothetical protein